MRPLLKRPRYDSSLRASISADERLALTLRFLATGNSQVWQSKYFCIKSLFLLIYK